MAQTQTGRDDDGAAETRRTGQTADEGQLVVFSLADEEFGVDIHNVKEIVRLPDITPIPRSPAYVAGICNLRGMVLPVIDTRKRFALQPIEANDRTRLLVVESGGVLTSMVVDSVREVRRVKRGLIEPPPEVCRGIDRQFLNGVVKVDEGKRLILMLDLSEVVLVDASRAGAESKTRTEQAQSAGAANLSAEEEQLVSFRVAEDEYAFHIEKVREILKVSSITAVPNVPDYVIGLFTIRNHLLPILDLRRLLGMPTLLTERHARMDRAMEEDRAWAENLRHTLASGSAFTAGGDAKQTSAGRWLEDYRTSSVEVESLVKQIKRVRGQMYDAAAAMLKVLQKSGRDAALAEFEIRVMPLSDLSRDTFGRLKTSMESCITEDQRALVVEAGGMTIGYQVDWVDEVLRIPRAIIDKTPAMATSERRELKAVARMDEGERLIMIMDESALVSREAAEVLSDIRDQAGAGADENGAERTLAEQSLEEEQLVTFAIAGEEYGIRIKQVQEINRLQDITRVPRAPEFIDGMTNLRGNVIPVINVRRLFDMPEIASDDRTRIIIVDIDGAKTGLRVDAVNEVLRLAKRDIEATPGIVSADEGAKLIQGVCKFDEGRRMVMLLDVAHLLNRNELASLGRVLKSDASAAGRSEKAGKGRPASGKKPAKEDGGPLQIAE